MCRLAEKLEQDIRKLELQEELHKRAKLLRRDSVKSMVESLHAIQESMLAEHTRNEQALEERLAETEGLADEETMAPTSLEEEEEGAVEDDRGILILFSSND